MLFHFKIYFIYLEGKVNSKENERISHVRVKGSHHWSQLMLHSKRVSNVLDQKEQGKEPAPVWDASMAVSILMNYTTGLAPQCSPLLYSGKQKWMSSWISKGKGSTSIKDNLDKILNNWNKNNISNICQLNVSSTLFHVISIEIVCYITVSLL